MSFILDTDLRESKHYIVPLIQDPSHRFLIQFDEKWKAEDFKRKLMAGTIKTPIQSLDSYEKIGEKELKGNIILIYRHI